MVSIIFVFFAFIHIHAMECTLSDLAEFLEKNPDTLEIINKTNSHLSLTCQEKFADENKHKADSEDLGTCSTDDKTTCRVENKALSGLKTVVSRGICHNLITQPSHKATAGSPTIHPRSKPAILPTEKNKKRKKPLCSELPYKRMKLLCPECLEQFQNRDSYKLHLRTCNEPAFDEQYPKKCKKCKNGFQNKERRNEHNKRNPQCQFLGHPKLFKEYFTH